jgi:hypothetical protein
MTAMRDTVAAELMLRRPWRLGERAGMAPAYAHMQRRGRVGRIEATGGVPVAPRRRHISSIRAGSREQYSFEAHVEDIF